MVDVKISQMPAATSLLATDQFEVNSAGAAPSRRATLSALWRKNALINGNFNIWQRGTSFAAIANAAYSADRWRYGKLTTGAVHTVSRSTDVPTVAQAGRLFLYSLLADCTTADAAVAAGDLVFLSQRIEGFNWQAFAQRALVVSFWVKATKTGIHCVALGNGVDRTYVGEYTIATTATWEYKTVTLTASPAAGTWDYTTGIGAELRFTLMAGSTYQTTAGAWQTGDFFATASQVNACDDALNDFRIAGVQLEIGSVATEIEAVPFEAQLARCQRYYAKTFPYATAPAQNAGTTGALIGGQVTGASTLQHLGWWDFPVQMRATPTGTTYNPSAANAQIRNIGTNTDWSGTTLYETSADRTNFYGTTPGGSTPGQGAALHLSADAEL